MGLPFDYSDQKVKLNLEVVEENTRTSTFDLSDKKTNYRKNLMQENITKKIKNGAVFIDAQELR